MYRYSICETLKPEVKEMGEINPEDVLRLFDEFPWIALLKQHNQTPEEEQYYSPSLEIENKFNHHGLTFSIVGYEHNHEYYIFYKRPAIKKFLFGLYQKKDENYLSDRTGQSLEQCEKALQALLDDDLEFLNNNLG